MPFVSNLRSSVLNARHPALDVPENPRELPFALLARSGPFNGRQMKAVGRCQQMQDDGARERDRLSWQRSKVKERSRLICSMKLPDRASQGGRVGKR